LATNRIKTDASPIRASSECGSSSNILDVLLAEIGESEPETVANLLVDRGGKAYSARLCQGFQSRRDVNPIAKDVAAFDNDIGEIDADAEPDAPFLGKVQFAFSHRAL
jgi:hypothetical protein